MHISFVGHNFNNLFILTKYYIKNFTTKKLLIIEHMVTFVVKFVVI